MKIERFEDIEAWKEARILVNIVYEATNLDSFKKDFTLASQMRKASVSGMSNIAEGFDRQSNKEFIQFLVIARASISEVKSQLYVALDQRYIGKEKFDTTYSQAMTIISLINGFIRYLQKSKNPNIEPRT